MPKLSSQKKSAMSKLYVVSPPLDIFERIYPEIKERIVCLPDFLRYPKDKFRQITRSLLLGHLPLPKQILYLWFPQCYLDPICNAKPGDSILIYECCNVNVLKTLKPLLPKGVDCHIYYCNPIRTICNDAKTRLDKIKELGFQLSTFDAYDAEEYGLKYTGQYFCQPPQTREAITCDCFFCGLPKDRANELENLRVLLEQNGLTCDFIIPRAPKEKVTYPEYLKRADRSRCIIDIAQSGQLGLTRRPLEALFYKKKLITNNPDLVKYDFYNKENIFIFGRDKESNLNEFVRSPFTEIPKAIYQHYDINSWLQNYLP